MADLNLAKFKKVKADKNCTTLRHENGHEVRIVHSVLSPKTRKELDRLKIHAADGADVPDAAPAQDNSTPPGPTSQPDPSLQREPSSDSRPMGQSSMEAPDAPSVQGQQDLDPVATGQTAANDLLNESTAQMQDYMTGHIQPKTYSDLFADKSTLGKIGTLFGLMLGGAGSGLSHQPNALLNMMDQQIKNDYDAQQKNVQNKQSFFTLAMQNKLNQAQVIKQYMDAGMTYEQAFGKMQENQIMARGTGLMATYNAVHHNLLNNVINSPMPPQQKAAAAQVLSNAHQEKQQQIANQTGQQVSAIRAQQQNSQSSRAPQSSEDQVLAPHGDDIYNNYVKSVAFDKTKQPELERVQSQYNGVVQAEKSLQQVAPVMSSLYDVGKQGGAGSRFERGIQEGLGGIPLIGAELGTAWAGAGNSPETRKYLANKQALYGMVSSALKGTNLGDATIRGVVDTNQPDPSDSPEDVAEKINNIKQFIRLHLDTGDLEANGIVPKHTGRK